MLWNSYHRLNERMSDKLALPWTYAVAAIRDGSDILVTNRGYETARVRPDNSVLLTIPTYIGTHWLKVVGNPVGIISVQNKPWVGGKEAHVKILYKNGTKISERKLVGPLEIYRDPVTNARQLMWKPENMPRIKRLPKEQQNFLDARAKEWADLVKAQLVKKVLKGESQQRFYSYTGEYSFTKQVIAGTLSKYLGDFMAGGSTIKNISRWKYSPVILKHYGLTPEYVE